MAVAAVVAGTATADTSNASSYATASWTPVATRLYLVAVFSTKATAIATLPTVSGNSMTWTQVVTQLGGATADTRRCTVFRGVAVSPTAGALTADFGGVGQTGCGIHISEWTGTDTGGTNGSNAIVQSLGGAGAVGTGSNTLTITLATLASASSGSYGAFSSGATTHVHGTAFTALTENGFSTPAQLMVTEWAINETAVTSITTGSNNWLGVAAEIKAAASGTNAAAGLASGTGTAL